MKNNKYNYICQGYILIWGEGDTDVADSVGLLDGWPTTAWPLGPVSMDQPVEYTAGLSAQQDNEDYTTIFKANCCIGTGLCMSLS